ncbi:MAG TPA: sulfurtransferase TusA family protein [Geobacteraceae bacterium]|nr:sulfurtransferase TusA family protein [Geobacteraceae bacterium]
MENVHTIEFDISGQICPSTLLVALREINRNIGEINAGRVRLAFKTDNRDCTNTIPEAVGNMGLKAEVHKDNARYTILVSKG